MTQNDRLTDHERDAYEHERIYRLFVRYARVAAFATPFFFTFILYWTQ